MKFMVLTAMGISSTLLCDVTPCSLLDKCQYFERNVLKLQIIPFRYSIYFTIYVCSNTYVGVLVKSVFVFTVFLYCLYCVACIVSFMYIYSYLFFFCVY